MASPVSDSWKQGIVEDPNFLSGEDVLEGFNLNIGKIWGSGVKERDRAKIIIIISDNRSEAEGLHYRAGKANPTIGCLAKPTIGLF